MTADGYLNFQVWKEIANALNSSRTRPNIMRNPFNGINSVCLKNVLLVKVKTDEKIICSSRSTNVKSVYKNYKILANGAIAPKRE